MATAFPEISPSRRSFSAPKFSTTTLVSQSGVVTRRLWGSRPNRAVLNLEFSAISDNEAGAILNAFNSARGSIDTLELPHVIFQGIENPLKSWIEGSAGGAGLIWSFAEDSAPQVDSVSPGRSNVRVTLTAELRMS